MSYLISRSELLKHCHRVTEYDEAGFSMEYNAVSVEDIKNAPAAYDVDKVVKEIKEVGTRFCCVSVHCNNECSNCDHGAIMKAIIEIVKGGGVNER